MNEFIELRNKFYEYDNPYSFPLAFLDQYIKTSKTISIEVAKIIKKIQRVKSIEFKDSLDEDDLCEILSFVGVEDYLDRYIADLIIKNKDSYIESELKSIISSIIIKYKYDDSKLYHLIDIAIECNIVLLDEETIYFLLANYEMNYDIISILLDYIYSFRIFGFKDKICNLLKCNYPDNLKLQIVDLILELYGLEEIDYIIEKDLFKSAINKSLYNDYIAFVQENLGLQNEGLIILQSMFYGDFEDSGKGNNGGLAVLLKSLGNEISKDDRVSRVFTITISDDMNKPFTAQYEDKHLFVRLPIYLNKDIKDSFIKRELAIKRYIHRFFNKTNIDPDVFHIRYLDNASRAVAALSKELDKKLVLTITPDPHRHMFDEDGYLKEFSFTEFIGKLNKIKIGDELLHVSDGILGIGNQSVKEELDIYFPELNNKIINKKIRMISEGIQQKVDDDHKHIEDMIDKTFISEKIDKEFFEKPIVLNVGRLDDLKGQTELLKAWGDSKLSETHNLLIIGGDLENPSAEETRIINYFNKYLESNSKLKNHFCHLGAIPNTNIRILEKTIMKEEFNYPHIYLCSSKKEEFGIAILEASSQGFLIIAPIKGGVKSYISNGENGFLINTSSAESISRETEEIIYNSQMDNDRFKTIQKAGRRTVEELFSIEKISQEFLSFYLWIKGDDDSAI